MKLKNGLCEIAVVTGCCIVSLAMGHPWEAGLILAGGVAVLFAIFASIVNYKALPREKRVTALDCLVAPYSTLLTIVPLAIMLPGIEVMQRLQAAEEDKRS